MARNLINNKANWYMKSVISANSEQLRETLRELLDMGAEIVGNRVKLYRGGDMPQEQLRRLRYNDYLSTVKEGVDAYGNMGASSYGENIVEILVPIEFLQMSNGEVQYKGPSHSLKNGKYPLKIYRAFNDYYGANYTTQEIDKMDFHIVRSIASMALEGGREEFDTIIDDFKT